MDRLNNLTHGTNATSNSGQNCVNSSGPVDKLLLAPSLSSVNEDLRWIFPLHTYGFACLFFVLSFYTLFSILNLRSLISSRPFMSTINIFLCLLGASRSGCLFIDPYNLQETMPKIIGSILWDIGFPCVTSAFCLIQLAFLQLTQLKFGPEKIQKESCLSLIITCHFSCVIASDIALAFHNHFVTKYIVQTIFLTWSILLYLTFLHAGYKIMHLLKALPNNLLTRDNSLANQKGIMQLAMLAPYNNLATSVAAALVPTLLNPKYKNDDNDPVNPEESQKGMPSVLEEWRESPEEVPRKSEVPATSTVPEVYVRPPTPTPAAVNLPIIMVSSPSRRSSIASSRRGSDASKGSRRGSDCSVRFANDNVSQGEGSSRPITPEGIHRRHSDMPTPTGSNKDLRRCSDVTHEKNRSSQFATKLRRNSDFGNRTPKRMISTEGPRLPKVLDVSPVGSRRNSDISGLAAVKTPESRRNSDVSYRRNSEFSGITPLVINRRCSDVSIRTLDKSPTHFQTTIPKMEITEKSESDSDHPDCNEKAALMAIDGAEDKPEEGKHRKKSLSWKNVEVLKGEEDITAASTLLPEGERVASDFTLHAILNHIAYVNRAKSDVPLHIPEASTAAARKSQIKRVLNVTYATAVLGIILCCADIGRIFGPYGLLGEISRYGKSSGPVEYLKPWPWLVYQTICRALELMMGCAMASLTKQPSVSPRHQYFNNYRSYSAGLKPQPFI
ncbi:uncharacterized protein [Fopius arisanus]|uniref:Prrt3 protein n=1 Tax=Fopius arisanus TaxID=64838 RepID=A0A0C9RBF3_9HYME|nr:PREDICTED: uncharacterized protein LOC105263317 [Fopius arisanus]XP_011297751.1 PREDICTED: uncharacterized protein LOC105263317 [Fopius arisanus]